MKHFIRLVVFCSVLLLFFNCNKKENAKSEETILKGSATFLVDETLTPIVEDQVDVFVNKYDAKIKLVSKSEAETVNDLFKNKGGVAVLSRDLTKVELKIFEKFKIVPKRTKFALDAIAFIAYKENKDTLIALSDVVGFLTGKSENKIKGLVFDNPNSSTVRFMKELAGVDSLPEKGVFSFKTNNEVIQFVSENKGMIGVVGVNWLSQPTATMAQIVRKVNVLHVKGLNKEGFFAPSQNNLAEGTYPLARDLFVINCQGYSGLGMGFSSFVAGDIGQRIILKSGLLPVQIPGRKLSVRKEIINDKIK
jgi:phosphate transport system substrate-binding protein